MINFGVSMRIGFGIDVHCFGDGDHIVLGGVKIPHHRGIIAHSDGDVLVHALCDALLGSLSLGDIGQHFPDTDQQFSKIDSLLLLKKVLFLVRNKGYLIANIDATVLAQRPKIASFIPSMQKKLSDLLGVDSEQISIKATTTEKLGFVGREEGIEAHCAVLVLKEKNVATHGTI